MTLVAALAQLAANPLDPDNSPALSVFEGDLTNAEQSGLDKKLPYAVVLGLPEVVGSRMLSGAPNLNVTLDIYIEHVGKGGERPDKAIIMALRNQVLRAATLVTEYEPGWPFAKPPQLISGMAVSATYLRNTSWSCTLRFRGSISADFRVQDG